MFAYVCKLCYVGVKTVGSLQKVQIGLMLTSPVNSGKKMKMSHIETWAFSFISSFLDIEGTVQNFMQLSRCFPFDKILKWWAFINACNTRCVMRVFIEVSVWLLICSMLCCFYYLSSQFKVKGNCSQPQEGFYFILKGTEPMTICLLSLLAF